mmetsp:Transcript_27007/g.56277  ORF Transcript_27007/g.56277 Transcript_27007/m.56277 type:complete len:249 (+) Transcript_27007:157-903(+)
MDPTKTLQGYRLVLREGNGYYEHFYRGAGASILDASRAPKLETEFKDWWRREVDKADRDRVVLVVLKPQWETIHGRWLRKMEEEEWYNSDEVHGRIRTTTAQNLSKTLYKREILTDDWGDTIERGAGSIGSGVINADGGTSTSEEPPSWFVNGVCVRLMKNGAEAVIRECSGSTAIVEIAGDTSTLGVTYMEVAMVPPVEYDMVLVTGGTNVGLEGELVYVGGMDAILWEPNMNFTIVNLVYLAKIAG